MPTPQTPPQHLSLPIRSVSILSMPTMKEDRVTFELNIPSPYPGFFLKMEFSTPKDQGADYVRKHFGIEAAVRG